MSHFESAVTTDCTFRTTNPESDMSLIKHKHGLYLRLLAVAVFKHILGAV